MDNFKSFNEFRKEQHAGKIPEDGQRRSIEESTPLDLSDDGFSTETTEEVPKTVSHRKSKKHRSQPWKVYGIACTAMVLLLLLVLLFLPIPLGNIHLTGTKTLTEKDILFEGQVREPVNVLQISTSDLEERLRHDIRVADVQVNRRFPFTLEVQIEDRIPLAAVQGELSYAFLDKNGMVIDSVRSIRKTDVPMITGKRLGNLLLGDQVSAGDIEKALTFLNHLSEEGRKAFSEINIGNEDHIRAYTRDGMTVRLGSGTNMAEQAELAENMVGDVKARGLSVEYVDANLSSPFIKLKK